MTYREPVILSQVLHLCGTLVWGPDLSLVFTSSFHGIQTVCQTVAWYQIPPVELFGDWCSESYLTQQSGNQRGISSHVSESMKGVFLFHGHWLIIHRVGWPSCWIQQPVHPSWWMVSQCPWFTNLWKCSWVDRSTVYSVPLPTWKIISRVMGLLCCCFFVL